MSKLGKGLISKAVGAGGGKGTSERVRKAHLPLAVDSVPDEEVSSKSPQQGERVSSALWDAVDDKWIRGQELSRPVTLPNGAIVKCHLALIDPDEAVPSEHNARVQDLLTFDDPDVLELYRNIEQFGQSEPILVNHKKGGKYEVIYGTRRRYVVQRLNEEAKARGERGYPLLAYVAPSEITAFDVEALAEAENNNRQDLSVYEKAVRCAALMQKREPNGAIALRLQIHEKRVPIYKRLAEIPGEIVKTLESPKLLTVSAGEKLVKLKEELNGWEEIKAALENNEHKFADVGQLIKALPKARAGDAGLKAREKKQIKDVSGKVKFSYSWGRNKVGKHLKIDAFDLSEQEFEKLVKQLESLSNSKR